MINLIGNNIGAKKILLLLLDLLEDIQSIFNEYTITLFDITIKSDQCVDCDLRAQKQNKLDHHDDHERTELKTLLTIQASVDMTMADSNKMVSTGARDVLEMVFIVMFLVQTDTTEAMGQQLTIPCESKIGRPRLMRSAGAQKVKYCTL